MKKLKILTLFTLVTSTTVFAKNNHFLLMGGGGEGTKQDTIFDGNLNSLTPFIQSQKWNYSAVFNGGHPKTEQIVKKVFTNPETQNQHFTASNYEKTITELSMDILTGKIKPGDQMLIVIDTHGAESLDEKSHSIATTGGKAITDLNSLSNQTLVSLDRLSNLIEEAEKNGIKLAIVDFSCHSGNTLNLKRSHHKNLCIISSTGPNHYGYAGDQTFGRYFIQNLTKSDNLEEAFLKARSQSLDHGFPMISTDAGIRMNNNLYEGLGPYFQYEDHIKNEGKLVKYIMSLDEVGVCKRESQFAQLTAQLNKFEPILQKNDATSKYMMSLINKYKSQQDELVKESLKLKNEILDKSEIFKITGINRSNQLTHTYKEILSMDPNSYNNDFMDLLKSNHGHKANYSAIKTDAEKYLQTVNKIREDLIQKHPHLKDTVKYFKESTKRFGDLFQLTSNIAREEKRIFDILYKEHSTKNNNECANFKL